MKPFERLVSELNLPRNSLWKYLQIRHLLVSVIGKGIPPQQSNLLSQTTMVMGLGHSLCNDFPADGYYIKRHQN